jgi:predicted amidohydrolase
VFDVPGLGRLGVGVCYDNYHATTCAELAAGAGLQPELVLLPHAAPTPPVWLGLARAEVDAYRALLRRVGREVATATGAPTVFTNHTGLFNTVRVVVGFILYTVVQRWPLQITPAWYLRPWRRYMTENCPFEGGAYISEGGSGRVLAEAPFSPAAEAAVITADVELAPPDRPPASPAQLQQLVDALQMPPTFQRAFPLNEWFGKRAYAAAAALRASGVK